MGDELFDGFVLLTVTFSNCMYRDDYCMRGHDNFCMQGFLMVTVKCIIVKI